MLYSLFFILALICPMKIYTQENPFFLHYLSGQTVVQNNKMTIDFFENCQYKQSVESDFMFTAQQSDFPISHGPADAQHTFRKIKFEFITPEELIAYDTENPQLSHMDSELAAHCTQLDQLLNRPITLHFNNHLQLDNPVDDQHDLSNELPLVNIFPQDFFNDSLSHIFALAGEELVVGKTYQKTVKLPEIASSYTINYTVLKITDLEVIALIAGEFEFQDNHLDLPLKEASEDKTLTLGLTLKGKITGKAVWNKENALVYQIDTHSQYRGATTIQSEGKNEPEDIFFKLNLVHHMNSRIKT